MPFTVGQMLQESDFAADELVTIDCAPYGYPECGIQSPNSQIAAMIKELQQLPKSAAKKMYLKVKKNLTGIDIDKAYDEQGQVWKNFCDDIAIRAALELVLFKTLIPLGILKQSSCK